MSGRVRWRRLRWTAADVVLVRGADWIGDIGRDVGDVWRAVHPGAARAVRTFRRRSDAKRWLLARAAGLAEVPRRHGCQAYRKHIRRRR